MFDCVSMTPIAASQIVNSGNAYLNVHNVPNPMGVIRGQVSSESCCGEALLT